ncbi:MAG TPA: TadE family protein [Chloroflexota bacterium]|nr:TadE family protein [Chloroflexota bacterium]
MIEFAILLTVLLLLVMGIMDFGFMFTGNEELASAARNGARYASVHPTSWTNAASPASNTIEGMIMNGLGNTKLTNDDSHITIAWLTPSGVACGQYSESSNSFVAQSGQSQSSCVVAGALIKVTVSYTYTPITPYLHAMWPNGVTLTSTATMAEEQ